MIVRLLALLALVSPFFFPWPYTLLLTGLVMVRYPFVALAVGLIFDALYAPSFLHGTLPFATIGGALATTGAVFIRRFILTHVSLP